MTNLQLLSKYVSNFMKHSKIMYHKELKVTLFNGEKPSNYYVPQPLDYLNHPPYSNRGSKIEMSIFLEIWIDGLCIWRKSRPITDGESNDLLESMAERMLDEIFLSGMFNSWNVIKEYKTKTNGK